MEEVNEILKESPQSILGSPRRKYKGEIVILYPPMPDEILAEGFNYDKYSNEVMEDAYAMNHGKYQGHLKEFESLFDDNGSFIYPEPEDITVEQIKYSDIYGEYSEKALDLDNKYDRIIFALQHKYEKAKKKGFSEKINVIITQAMQEVTQERNAYLQVLAKERDEKIRQAKIKEQKEQLKTQELERQKILEEEKQKRLEEIQRQLVQKRRESMDRIKKFKQGKLELKNLTYRDTCNPFISAKANICGQVLYNHLASADSWEEEYVDYSLSDLVEIYHSINPDAFKKPGTR